MKGFYEKDPRAKREEDIYKKGILLDVDKAVLKRAQESMMLRKSRTSLDRLSFA